MDPGPVHDEIRTTAAQNEIETSSEAISDFTSEAPSETDLDNGPSTTYLSTEDELLAPDLDAMHVDSEPEDTPPPAQPKAQAPNAFALMMSAAAAQKSKSKGKSSELKRQTSNIGLAASSKRSRANNAAVNNGTFEVIDWQWESFVERVRLIDPEAVDYLDPRSCGKRILHPACGQTYEMKTAYDTYRFKLHVNVCDRIRVTELPQIHKYFEAKVPDPDSDEDSPSGSRPKQARKHSLKLPCPGITEKDDARVKIYLSWKMSYNGGGGVSERTIAKEQYPNVAWSDLSKSQKEFIRLTQRNTWQWTIDWDLSLVRSTKCQKDMSERELMCKECQKVLKSRAFKVAINKKPASPENIKYMRKEFRLPGELGKLYAKLRGFPELLEEVSTTLNQC